MTIKTIQQLISKLLLASYSLLATIHATSKTSDITTQLRQRSEIFKKNKLRPPQQNNNLLRCKNTNKQSNITNLQETDIREKEEQELQKELSYLKGGVHVLEQMLDNMDKHSEERKKTHKEFDENLEKMKKKINKKIEEEEKKYKEEIVKLDKNIEKLRKEREEADKKNIKEIIQIANMNRKKQKIKKICMIIAVGVIIILLCGSYIAGAMASGVTYIYIHVADRNNETFQFPEEEEKEYV